AGVLAAIAVAYSIKTLAIALVLAYLTSIALQPLLYRQRDLLRANIRAFAPTLVTFGIVILAAAAAGAVAAGAPTAALGKYGVVAGNVDLLAVPWWFFLHVAEVDLYVAFIPFAASLLLVALVLRSRLDVARARLFVALFVPLVFWTTAIVAAYASKSS